MCLTWQYMLSLWVGGLRFDPRVDRQMPKENKWKRMENNHVIFMQSIVSINHCGCEGDGGSDLGQCPKAKVSIFFSGPHVYTSALPCTFIHTIQYNASPHSLFPTPILLPYLSLYISLVLYIYYISVDLLQNWIFLITFLSPSIKPWLWEAILLWSY